MFSRKRQHIYLSDKFQRETVERYDIFTLGEEDNRAEYVGQVVSEEYAKKFIFANDMYEALCEIREHLTDLSKNSITAALMRKNISKLLTKSDER